MKRDAKRELDRLRSLGNSTGSALTAEVVLVFVCVTIGAFAYELWWLFGWYAIQYTLVFSERSLLKATPHKTSHGFFALILCLNFLIGSNFGALSVFLWQVDHAVFKFAVVALLTGSTLNTFLARTTVWQAMLCYVVPNCVAVLLIASSFRGPAFGTSDLVTALVIALSLMAYFLVSVAQAYRWHESYEKTRLNLELARRSEAIGRLTGGIAHDFNNLLVVILGNLETLRETARDKSQVGLIDDGIHAAERGADLTRNMLRYARDANLSRSRVDLNGIARELTRFLARTMPDNVSIDVDLSDDLWVVESDASSTESALLNLLLNARDAMPEGGTVRISTRNVELGRDRPLPGDGTLPPGHYVRVEVRDSGHGIPDKDLPHIFEPFTTSKPSGTGLGLTMIDVFMKKSGGAIGVTSNEGAGTTFSLFFPALRDPAAQAEQKAPRPRAGTMSRARILFVEDDDDVRTALLRMLEHAPHEIVPANSGDTAWDLFQTDPAFDLLITDVIMPGALQGPDLAERVRSRKPDLPVLFLTGNDLGVFDGHKQVRESDVKLTKPMRRKDLLDAIAMALDAG